MAQTEEQKKAALDAQIGEYEVGRLIGSGMIGVVAVARHYLSKRIVVLKCMSVEKIIEKGKKSESKVNADPVESKPAAKKPAVKKPAVNKPAAKKPAVKKPAAKKPTAKKSK